MFTYARSLIAERTEHPLLFSLFLVAGGFLLAAVVVDRATGNGVASGFLLIYAGLAGFLGAAGYAGVFTARALSIVQDQRRLT